MSTTTTPLAAAAAAGQTTLQVDPSSPAYLNDYRPELPEQCSPWKVAAMRAAVKQGAIGENTPLAIIWNLSEIKRVFETIQTAFPAHFLHTVAAKANPQLQILQYAKENGLGCECASLGELTQAIKAGFRPETIVFDSPVKTKAEIAFALANGVNVNVDNFQELAVLDSVRTAHVAANGGHTKSGLLGIRINPEVGAGAIETHSTSVPWSKFGIGLLQYGEELFQAYKERPWLNMVHVHAGSQGMALEAIVEAIRRCVDFAHRVNTAAGYQQVKTIDIGGGLPVNFESELYTPDIPAFVAQLRARVPELFSGDIRAITEYGRWYLAKAGFIASRVEYTKVAGGRHIALQHAGADLCLRTVYHPEKWPLRLTVFDNQGALRTATPSALKTWDIGGPCCIAGDVIARLRPLPDIAQGDIIAVHDTGAYYHPAWSFYNSRQAPALLSYDERAPDAIKLIRPAATVQETLAFFS